MRTVDWTVEIAVGPIFETNIVLVLSMSFISVTKMDEWTMTSTGVSVWFSGQGSKNFESARQVCEDLNGRLFEPRDTGLTEEVLGLAATLSDPWTEFMIGVGDWLTMDR